MNLLNVIYPQNKRQGVSINGEDGKSKIQKLTSGAGRLFGTQQYMILDKRTVHER